MDFTQLEIIMSLGQCLLSNQYELGKKPTKAAPGTSTSQMTSPKAPVAASRRKTTTLPLPCPATTK